MSERGCCGSTRRIYWPPTPANCQQCPPLSYNPRLIIKSPATSPAQTAVRFHHRPPFLIAETDVVVGVSDLEGGSAEIECLCASGCLLVLLGLAFPATLEIAAVELRLSVRIAELLLGIALSGIVSGHWFAPEGSIGLEIQECYHGPRHRAFLF